VLSRGMNIPRVEYVINFDHPQNYSEEYVHRVGRCGRVGNFGRAITFFDPKRDYAAAPSLIEGCKAAGQEIPQVLLKCLNYNSYNEYNNYGPPNNFFNNQNWNYSSGTDSGIGTHNNSSDENYHFSSYNENRPYNY